MSFTNSVASHFDSLNQNVEILEFIQLEIPVYNYLDNWVLLQQYMLIALSHRSLFVWCAILQVSVRVRDKSDHSVMSVGDLLKFFKEEVAAFH